MTNGTAVIVVRCAVAALIGVATFGYRYLTYSGFPNDHFVHLTTAQQMTLGALPVRDYVERGMPLMVGVSALAQEALGDGLHAEVQLVAAMFAVAAVLVYVVAVGLSGSTLVGVAAAATTVLVHPAAYSYPKLLVYALAFAIAWLYAGRPTTGRLVVLALAVVVAFLFRHDHGIFLGAGALALLIGVHGVSRQAVAVVGRFLVLGVIFVSPYLAWVQAYEGLGAYAADGLAFSGREAERAAWFNPPAFGVDRTQPLFTRMPGSPDVNVRWTAEISDQARVERERANGLVRGDSVGPMTWQYELRSWSRASLERLVRDPAVADTQGIDREQFRLTEDAPSLVSGLLLRVPVPTQGLRLRANALAAMYYVVWVMPLLTVAILAIWWRRLAPVTRALAAMAVVVQLGMNFTMLRDPLDLRIRDVVVPMAVMLALAVAWAWSIGGTPMLRWSSRVVVSGLLLLVLGVAGALGPVHEHLRDSGVLDGVAQRQAEVREELAPPAHRTGRVSESYEKVVEYITSCTAPDARLLAMTFIPELFFYTGRGFAGGQVALTPGYYTSERHATRMLDRVTREDVPLVILDSDTEAEIREAYPRVMEWVLASYHRIAEFPLSGDKRLILLAESTRVPVREIGADRLPCYAGASAG